MRTARSLDDVVDRSARPGACWLFTGAVAAKPGYGMVTVNGRKVGAHRLTLERKLGRPLRQGFECCHTCDNRRCCNPSHLYEGTRSENVRDAVARGRHRFTVLTGDKHPLAKLSADDVRAIRAARGVVAGKDLAVQYGVSPSLITLVQRGKAWKWAA